MNPKISVEMLWVQSLYTAMIFLVPEYFGSSNVVLTTVNEPSELWDESIIRTAKGALFFYGGWWIANIVRGIQDCSAQHILPGHYSDIVFLKEIGVESPS